MGQNAPCARLSRLSRAGAAAVASVVETGSSVAAFPRLLAAVAAAAPASSPAAVRTITGTFNDGATYKIEVPGHWNGTLFLYSHGYVTPGSANPATDAGDPVTGGWLLGHGYALAGSSYASTGWAIQQALTDQIHTINVFDRRIGTPLQTIAWGHSLGGIITAGLIQDYPGRFSAALPMCGVLSGGVATWNTALDGEFAFQQLIDPSGGLQLVNITDPTSNLTRPRKRRPAPRRAPRRARRGSPWSPRSATRRAGSPRCRRSLPRTTTRPRRPTSTSGTPR